MITHVDTDADIWTPHPQRGVIPRRDDLVYGGREAEKIGLAPVHESVPDGLINPSDYKEAIQHCKDEQIFPMYHQANAWAPAGYRFSQDGLNYCWTWSGTAALMDMRAMEDKTHVDLAPVSMGYLVGWRNDGNYLESFIKGARERGVTPVEYVGDSINSTNRNSRTYKTGWEEARKNFRLDKVWDTNARAGDALMLQHCLTILNCAKPLFCAWNWWGHAVECCGILWDESKYLNVIWVLRNSHNEDDYYYLSGQRGVPDEAYGFISTKLMGSAMAKIVNDPNSTYAEITQ